MANKSLEQPAAAVSLSKIAVSDTHGENSPYFAGWKAYDENPYHETSNPSGVIQMGLAENQVSSTLHLNNYRIIPEQSRLFADELLLFFLLGFI